MARDSKKKRDSKKSEGLEKDEGLEKGKGLEIKGLLSRYHIYKVNLSRFRAKYPVKQLVDSNFENYSKVGYS